MDIIRPSFQILAMTDHPELPYQYEVNPELLIEAAGRTCYRSEEAITKESAIKFVQKIEKDRHLTVLEHSWLVGTVNHMDASVTRPTNWNKYLYLSKAYKGSLLFAGNRRAWQEAFTAGPIKKLARFMKEEDVKKIATLNNEPFLMCATVRLINDRGVSHEEVRHRLPGISQESTRYVNYVKKLIQFVQPPWVDVNNFTVWSLFSRERRPDLLWFIACWGSEFIYRQLIKHGWKPQQARDVLINSLKTELVMSCNLQEWQHIFRQRALGLTGAPHPQMREIMWPLWLEFDKMEPKFFSEKVLRGF